MNRRPPPALALDERRVLVAVELLARRNGRPPTWRELRNVAGIGADALPAVVFRLRRRRLLKFTDEPRSLAVTARGLAAALAREARA